jgi:hypothetical protein
VTLRRLLTTRASYTFGRSANVMVQLLYLVRRRDSFRIRHGATESVRFGPSETAFNEGSARHRLPR